MEKWKKKEENKKKYKRGSACQNKIQVNIRLEIVNE